MNRSQFSKTANAAIKEGRIARRALAEHHANHFVNGARDFDPRTLTKLGSAGMKRFIQIVQASGTSVDSPPESTHEQPAAPTHDAEKISRSWTTMQRPEPNWVIRAMMYGTFIGNAFFLCGTAVLATLPL